MTPNVFKKLRPGDIVQHVSSGRSFVVTSKVSDKDYIAVRTIRMRNAKEWRKLTVKELAAIRRA